jgi:hypothetical protein
MNKECLADSLVFGYYDREIFDKPIDFDDYNPDTGLVKAPIEYPSDSLLVKKEEEIEHMREIFDKIRENTSLGVLRKKKEKVKI